VLEDEIRHCTEFLVWDTPDYVQSWWTRVELLALAYAKGRGLALPQLSTLSPDGERSPGLPFPLPEMTRAERRRYSRWCANTNPSLIAPHTPDVIRALTEVLPLARRIPVVSDHVWSSEFRNLRLAQCSARPAEQSTPSVDSDLWLSRSPELLRIPPAEFELAASNGGMRCPGCGRDVTIGSAPPRYTWIWDDVPGTTRKGTLIPEPVWLWEHPA
jgi:hypothetical protein